MATIKTRNQWASALLGALGLPDTRRNVRNIVGWEKAEGGNWSNTAKYNPLNTSMAEPGSEVMPGGNASGVQAYPNWSSGLDATVATLESSGYGYSKILADLNTNASWSQFSSDVASSGWGTKNLNKDSQGSGNPNAASYQSGVTATQQSGAAANSPSKQTSGVQLTGFAGALQALDSMYNPGAPGGILGPFNFGGDIKSVSTMIVTRSVSSILFLIILLMGVKGLTSGSSSFGGSTNVLEFVNNAKIGNEKRAISRMRLESQQRHEGFVERRHQARLADNAANRSSRERVAATPRVSHKHIWFHSNNE